MLASNVDFATTQKSLGKPCFQ